MRTVLAGACAALCALATSPAFAACTFKVLPVPVTIEGTLPVITVKISGQEAHFLIDSGSVTNLVSYKLLASRNLMKKPDGNSRFVYSQEFTGANGKVVASSALVLPEIEFLGTTFRNIWFNASDRVGGMDGLIGQPMLRQMDVEYDLKDKVIRLVKTDDCKTTEMIYWAKPGQPYSKMPMAWEDRDDPGIFGDVFINGKKLRAKFDTGASSSFITQSAAAKAGVKTTDPGVVAIGKAAGIDADFDAWIATFENVKIGDEEIKNAPFLIGQSTAHEFDVLIGADFFLSHHVYVSHIQNKIYFAYEGGPPFQAQRFIPSKAVPPRTTDAKAKEFLPP